MNVIIGTHGFSSAPASKPALGNGQGLVEKFITRGGTAWFNIPSAAARSGGPTVNIWTGLQTGAIKGFALDASNKGTGAAWYGTFQPVAVPTYAPRLRITYMK
jgi:hypothetical protein